VTQRDATSPDLMNALSSNYSSQFPDDSFAMQGTPRYSNLAAVPALDVNSYVDVNSYGSTITFSYLNNQNHSQQAVFYATLKNSYNQTLQVIAARSTLPEGKTVQIPLTFQNQAAGVYRINLFAITPKGVALAVPFNLLLNSTDTSQPYVNPYAASPIS
jgi:hypothetical protein